MAAPIMSTDENAPDRLAARIAKLEADQTHMKKVNGLVRKKDSVGLAALGYSEDEIAKFFKGDFLGRVGFPNYLLTNNNSNIRRLRERLAQITSARQAA